MRRTGLRNQLFVSCISQKFTLIDLAELRRELGSLEFIMYAKSNYSANAHPIPATKKRFDLDGEDFYPTPTWATLALLKYETFNGSIWECACGDGAMSEVFEAFGHDAISTGKFDRGFGQAGVDFLEADAIEENIATNPPYALAGEFAEAALAKSRKKSALLLRLAFLEGAERHNRIFSQIPPSRVWVFSERITFYPKYAERKGSGTTAYCWAVWDKSSTGNTELGWIAPGFKPGSRSRSALFDQLPAAFRELETAG